MLPLPPNRPHALGRGLSETPSANEFDHHSPQVRAWEAVLDAELIGNVPAMPPAVLAEVKANERPSRSLGWPQR